MESVIQHQVISHEVLRKIKGIKIFEWVHHIGRLPPKMLHLNENYGYKVVIHLENPQSLTVHPGGTKESILTAPPILKLQS